MAKSSSPHTSHARKGQAALSPREPEWRSPIRTRRSLFPAITIASPVRNRIPAAAVTTIPSPEVRAIFRAMSSCSGSASISQHSMLTMSFLRAAQWTNAAVPLHCNPSRTRATPGMFGSGYYEMLARQITADLESIRDTLRPGQGARLTSKGISFGVLARRMDGTWITAGIEGLSPESTASPDAQHPPSLLILPFSQAGATVSLRVFTVNAFNQH